MAALAHRGHDVASLTEAVRRIAFCVVIGNGAAHLKNWSLIYRDKRLPALSPAYDMVATAPYAPGGDAEDLGLKLCGSRRFDDVRPETFEQLQHRLERRLGPMDADLETIAVETARRVLLRWPEHEAAVPDSRGLRGAIGDWIALRARALGA